ncbi:MAG: sigma-70 family RNA polymerase sigma factor [Pseudomonadota bacterium]
MTRHSSNEYGHVTKANEISSSDAATNKSRLTSLYDEHAEALIGSLRKSFGNGPPEPEDIAQSAFQRLAEYEELDAIKNLPAFLWRTARNLMISAKRSNDVRAKYDFEIEHLYFAMRGAENSPENVIDVRQQLKLINTVLESMPENRRVAFILHRVEGLNFAAVGRRLGMTRNGAIKHVARAVVDIQAALHAATER